MGNEVGWLPVVLTQLLPVINQLKLLSPQHYNKFTFHTSCTVCMITNEDYPCFMKSLFSTSSDHKEVRILPFFSLDVQRERKLAGS